MNSHTPANGRSTTRYASARKSEERPAAFTVLGAKRTLLPEPPLGTHVQSGARWSGKAEPVFHQGRELGSPSVSALGEGPAMVQQAPLVTSRTATPHAKCLAPKTGPRSITVTSRMIPRGAAREKAPIVLAVSVTREGLAEPGPPGSCAGWKWRMRCRSVCGSFGPSHNKCLEPTAQQRRFACCWVPSSLRSSASAQARRWASHLGLFRGRSTGMSADVARALTSR